MAVTRTDTWSAIGPGIGLVALLLFSGCATAPITRSGSLSSYERLVQSNGVLAKSFVKVTKNKVLAAKTVRIVPTVFVDETSAPELSEKQRLLVANAVDRTMCSRLSERFEVVPVSVRADLTVRAVITRVKPTKPVVAAASKAASLAPKFFLPDYFGPVPRIPIGLGSLSVEAEARGPDGEQSAAMLWARGASSFMGATRISKDGDAYELAPSFAEDFSKLLVTGKSPFRKLPSLPSFQGIKTSLGARPKYAACETFGRSPGIRGFVGRRLGLPPGWTDRGPIGQIEGAKSSDGAAVQTSAQNPRIPKSRSCCPRPLIR